MKIMLVHPGATWSTHDVWWGVKEALERAGVELVHIALDGRLEFAARFLDFMYRRHQGRLPVPTMNDKVYMASAGMVERALRFMPDWVLIIAGGNLHPDGIALLRRARMKVAIILTESPYQFDQEEILAERCNVVFTNERTAVEAFRPYCERAYYWQHAIDGARHLGSSDIADVPSHDVVFVGTGFIERIKLLRAIDWTDIDLGLYGEWTLLGSRNWLRRYVKEKLTANARAAALYRKAKIGLNLHRTSVEYECDTEHFSDAESMNPRCYELAAAGCFFITDWRAEIEDVFGDLVPTFKTAEEAENLIYYYLEHDDEREAIAAQLPDLVKHETFDERITDLLAVLNKS